MKLFRVDIRETGSPIFKERYIVADNKLKAVEYLSGFCVFDDIEEIPLTNESIVELSKCIYKTSNNII